MNAHQRRIARRHTHTYTIPIMALADDDEEVFGCQDCGADISFADGTAYVTASGDVYCRRCGRAMDEEQEEMDAEDSPWDFYPEPWYDAKSPISELEPDDTPRTRYIGAGSEYAVDGTDDAGSEAAWPQEGTGR